MLLAAANKSITDIANSVDINAAGKKTIEQIQKDAAFLQMKKSYKKFEQFNKKFGGYLE